MEICNIRVIVFSLSLFNRLLVQLHFLLLLQLLLPRSLQGDFSFSMSDGLPLSFEHIQACAKA